MSSDALTRDNPLLSRPTMPLSESSPEHQERASGSGAPAREVNFKSDWTDCEINFTTNLPADVAAYVERGLSENAKRAYAADLAHFEAWGGTVPATDTMVARYLAAHAETLSVATLSRRLATISKAHRARGLTSPAQSELVRATMRGIKRSRGTVQAEAKPLRRDELFNVVEGIGDNVKGVRDRALLLLGFAGGFRRSELVGLNVQDIEHVGQGVIVHLRRSKTDQEGAGRKIGIPFGKTRWCPIHALTQWLVRSGNETMGPVFRRINRHSHILNQRLSGEAVSLIVKERLLGAGIDPQGYSGHSLRAGFVTSAASAGASIWKIRHQTGHASNAMLIRYIRDEELFRDNAAARIL